jgi:hypothetical protein
VLSGRGLCDGLITRQEESYRLWCVVVCDLENLVNEEAMTCVGSQRNSKNYYCYYYYWLHQILVNVSNVKLWVEVYSLVFGVVDPSPPPLRPKLRQCTHPCESDVMASKAFCDRTTFLRSPAAV